MANTCDQIPNSSLKNAPQHEASYARPVMVAPPASCATELICILRLPEVMARVGICRASIYNKIAAGSFPKQIILGPRTVGWLESEINAWLMARIGEPPETEPKKSKTGKGDKTGDGSGGGIASANSALKTTKKSHSKKANYGKDKTSESDKIGNGPERRQQKQWVPVERRQKL